MNILFSPVGLTDPVSNFRDGAMIHICRFRQIDKVYLYLSKEVYEYENHDHRYSYCINMLAKQTEHKLEYEFIVKEQLEDVHLFDTFIHDFRKEITRIHQANPDDQLYLNVSSGTPAMKSALQILAAFREFDMIPIQVATPQKRSNPHVEEKWSYNPEEQWKCNDDNSDPIDRCSVSVNINFLLLTKKQMLAELINKYDYVGAQALADTMRHSLSDKFIELLDGAVKRFTLQFGEANTIYKKYNLNLLEAEQSNYAPITEYLLELDIRVRKQEYGKFIQGLTPLIFDLYEMILSNKMNIKLDNLTVESSYGEREWNIKELLRDANLQIKECLEGQNGVISQNTVYSASLNRIIQGMCNDERIKKLCRKLRSIEQTARNIAAHEIVSISDQWIKQKTNCLSADILDMFRRLIIYAGININNNFFGSYDRMNDCLIKALNE